MSVMVNIVSHQTKLKHHCLRHVSSRRNQCLYIQWTAIKCSTSCELFECGPDLAGKLSVVCVSLSEVSMLVSDMIRALSITEYCPSGVSL